MQIGLAALKSILLKDVVIVEVVRRIPLQTRPITRKMLCTNSKNILNSFNGRTVLNYRPPVYMQKYNPESYNLIVTWDIIMQDYRQLNMDACDLLETIPGDQRFWKYFNEKILPMTPTDKLNFMDL